MPPAIKVHCFPFDCFLVLFFACVVAALCYCTLNYALENIEISHAIRGAGSYNFYWLKSSSVIQSRTFSLRDKCPPFPSYPCASVLKRVFPQNLSYEDEFDFHENES